MSIFYYSIVESGEISLGMALGIPLMLVGIGLYIDASLRAD